jgi:hypothetical protein
MARPRGRATSLISFAGALAGRPADSRWPLEGVTVTVVA